MGLRSEFISWLGQKESPFISKMKIIGLRDGYDLQSLDDDEVFRDPGNGEYTGSGLCVLGSGALEEGIINVFGDQVITNGVLVAPKPKKYTYRQWYLHRVLRVAFPDEPGVTLDSTYRQFNFHARDKIYVVPAVAEAKMYGRGVLEVDPPGGATSRAKELVSGGRYFSIKMEDYQELVEILTG